MKKVVGLLVFLAFVFGSCSHEETPLEPESGNVFFPFAATNFWNYNVEFGAVNVGKDSLFIKKDTTINGIVYKKFKTKNTPIGFYTSTLNDNSLRKSSNSLVLAGNIKYSFSATVPINIPLNDFVVFSENAPENEVLSTITGVTNQVYENLPLTINYSLKSVALSSLTSFTTPKGRAFQNVKPIKMIMNLKINSTFSNFPVAILNSQDVVTCTLYYVKNVGVVYAKTLINYQLQSIPGLTLPIPNSTNQTQEEFLTTFRAQ